MQVEFEFDLADQRYNVIRKRLSAGRSRRSELEFGVWDEAEGTWRPLTEPSLRATRRAIIDLLRMDYETFVHSAFLKQGEADAFTSKSPGQRKDILASILNLAQYDLYADHAKNLAREAEGEGRLLQQRLNEIAAEVAQRPDYEEDPAPSHPGRKPDPGPPQSGGSGRGRGAAGRGRPGPQARCPARVAAPPATGAAGRDRHRGSNGRPRRRGCNRSKPCWPNARPSRMATPPCWPPGPRRKRGSNACNACARWNRNSSGCSGPGWRPKRGSSRPWPWPRGEAQEAEKRSGSLAGLQEEAVRVHAEIVALQAQQAEAQALRAQLAAVAAARSQHQAERDRVEVEGKRLRERQEMLHSGETADCPVCRLPLDEVGRGHLEAEYEAQLQGLREQMRAANEALKENTAAETQAQQALTQIERALRSLPAWQRQLAEIEAALEQAQQAAAALPALQTQVTELSGQLAAGAFAGEVQTQLAALAAEIAAQAYDEGAHRRAQATRSDLSGVERKKLALDEALQQIAGAREQAQRLQERHQREQAQTTADRAQLEQLQAAVQAQAAAEATVQQQMQIADRARAQWERSHALMVAAQQRLAACESLLETRQQLSSQAALIQARTARLRYLQEAFGPRGAGDDHRGGPARIGERGQPPTGPAFGWAHECASGHAAGVENRRRARDPGHHPLR